MTFSLPLPSWFRKLPDIERETRHCSSVAARARVTQRWACWQATLDTGERVFLIALYNLMNQNHETCTAQHGFLVLVHVQILCIVHMMCLHSSLPEFFWKILAFARGIISKLNFVTGNLTLRINYNKSPFERRLRRTWFSFNCLLLLLCPLKLL